MEHRVEHGSQATPIARRPDVRVAMWLLVVVLTGSLAAAVLPSARSEEGSDLSRPAVIVGAILPQPEQYFEGYAGSGANIVTSDDLARVASIPARQHPVNAGLFDAGCGQCHRLTGPLPPGSGAPADVFDLLAPARVETGVPAGFARLTASDRREEYPSWSPDGASILFEAADSAGRFNLWLMDADGGDQRQLTHHAAAGWATWNPDGRRLAYWAADDDGSGNLWLMDLVEGGSRRLTRHDMAAWPQWSPGGEHLAYQARDGGAWTLRLLHVESGGMRDITQVADDLPSRPIWSPDGGELLYQSLVGTRYELTRLVFPVGAGGIPDYAGEPERVATTTVYPIDLGAAAHHPAWSPESGRIAFAMYTLKVVPPGALAFSYKTWTISAQGTHPRLLLPQETLADRSPTWSGDGSWIAQWSWDGDLMAGIWLVDAGATRRIELTRGLGGDALYPAWSPDGTRIAFASNREGSFDVWVADVAKVLGVAPEVERR